MSKEAMKLARQIIWRYRHETPLGNQPYMIAHEADEAIERIDQALAKQEQGEPYAYEIQEGNSFTLVYSEAVHKYKMVSEDSIVATLYTTPQQRTTKPTRQLPQAERAAWVGLTDDEADECACKAEVLAHSRNSAYAWDKAYLKEVEAKLREKNSL